MRYAVAYSGFRRRQSACVFRRRSFWQSGLRHARCRSPTRGSGRNHRRQIVQGLFRASGMVILHGHRAALVLGQSAGSFLESRGGSVLPSAEVIADAFHFGCQSWTAPALVSVPRNDRSDVAARRHPFTVIPANGAPTRWLAVTDPLRDCLRDALNTRLRDRIGCRRSISFRY